MNLKSEINILILFQNLFLFLLYLYTNGGRCTKCHEYLNQERNIPYLLQTVAPTVQCKLMKTEKKINANYHLTEHFNLKFKHFVFTGLNVIKERIVSTHQFFKSQNCPYILRCLIILGVWENLVPIERMSWVKVVWIMKEASTTSSCVHFKF